MNMRVTNIAKVDDAVVPSQPLYASRTAAGFGVPGDDSIDDTLNVNDYLVKNPSATFFVRVSGDSMEGAKIFDGDVLVVDRSRTAKHNSIVIAAVNGEMVVKRLRLTANESLLVSENEHYAPIRLADSDDCFIWGVVTGSARTLS
jgi:DNA polymerase V